MKSLHKLILSKFLFFFKIVLRKQKWTYNKEAIWPDTDQEIGLGTMFKNIFTISNEQKVLVFRFKVVVWIFWMDSMLLNSRSLSAAIYLKVVGIQNQQIIQPYRTFSCNESYSFFTIKNQKQNILQFFYYWTLGY